MGATVIRHGDAVLPEGRRQVDLRLNDGRIEAIGPALEVAAGDEVIDASGLLVLPGIIDAHTHFELDTGKMQTRDDLYDFLGYHAYEQKLDRLFSRPGS